MTTTRHTSSRRPRADSERNRKRLIETAKHVFSEFGAVASLEQIAVRAGVGIGTLYRHFPTRDDLLISVYLNETQLLAEAAEELSLKPDPAEALDMWLKIFVEFLATKRGMAEALNTLIGGAEELYQTTPSYLAVPVNKLVNRGIEAGIFRNDIESLDLLRALGGIVTIRPDEDWKVSANKMVDILMKGIRG